MDQEIIKRGDLLATWRNRAFHYRQDPVPGVHKYRGGRYYFRHPKTLQELSSGYIADDLDYSTLTAPQIIKLTRVRNIPTAWDDIPRGDIRLNSSWKRHRSTQYYGVDI
jgi:hypothetical protein